ncbi:hypothetical protein QL285_093876 [Trifolium repens]|nr:hypothetical protein QL285_093876 [Trifolium repens]
MGGCATIEGVSSYAELLQLQKLSLDSKSAKEICSCSRFSLPDSSSASNGLVNCCGGLLRRNCFWSIRRNLKAFVNGGLLCSVGVSATVATCCDKE